LFGLKAALSEAGLHVLRQRAHQGLLNEARGGTAAVGHKAERRAGRNVASSAVFS